jgi:hypothetical protein
MIKAIKGQSVSLYDSSSLDFNERNKACTNDNEIYCQSVVKNQITQFQVKLFPLTGIELLTNAEFANNVTGWNPTGTMVETHSSLFGGSANLISTSNGTITQTVTGLTIGKYYEVETILRDFTRLNLSAISLASLNVNTSFIASGILFYQANQNVSVRDIKIKLWFTATATSHNISIQVQNAQVNAEYVRMKELTIPTAEVNTCDGDSVVSADVNLFKDVAIISVNWNDSNIVDAECYKICVFPADNENENLLSGALSFIDNFNQFIVDNQGRQIIG